MFTGSTNEVGESSTSTSNADSELIKQPVVVILDSSIIHHVVKYGLLINDIQHLFGGHPVQFFVTDCTVNELITISQRYPENDIILSVNHACSFDCWECKHVSHRFSAESCIKSVLGGIQEQNGFYVATTCESFMHELRLNGRNYVITADRNYFSFLLPIAYEDGYLSEEDAEPEMMNDDQRDLHYRRLHTRFHLNGFVEVEVDGDGNCQFRALSHQMYHDEEHHMEIRQAVVNQLFAYSNLYDLNGSPEKRRAYLQNMRMSGTWGDIVTLQAAADVYCLWIIVLESGESNSVFQLAPNEAFNVAYRYDRGN